MLQLKHVQKFFADRAIFSDLTWHIRPADRIGLCGENGAGKTTLLKLLAGEQQADAGDIQFAKGTTFGYLPQDNIVHRGKTLWSEVRSAFSPLLTMEAEIHRLEIAMVEEPSVGEIARYADLQEQFTQAGGYRIDAETARVLSGLGFSESEYSKSCELFSGGWQMRIALAKLLLQRPNLLLLDEPTNHLDLPARNWLEAYLATYPFAVVLVSHDRYFLDRVVGRIVEVWNGELTEYPGNYSAYLVVRDQRVMALRSAKERQDEEIARTEAFINRFRYQANKAAQVQSRVRQLEKVKRIQLPLQRKKIAFTFPSPPKGGKNVLELRKATQSYGDLTVFSDIDLCVEQGERIALVGANGAGKSTLMRLLAGVEQPFSGEKVDGHNLHKVYFAQDQAAALSGEKTVLSEIRDAAPFDMVPKVRDILGAFLFSGDDVEKKVSVLSGGERNRLALAILLLRPANLLLLDEPTNHLDLNSKEVLLTALKKYSGTMVFVSHDRYFVDNLATRVVEVANGVIDSWPGNYEDFLRHKMMEGDDGHSHERVESSKITDKETGGSVSQGDYAARKAAKNLKKRLERELASLENKIEESEKEQSELELLMADPELYQDAQRWKTVSDAYETGKDQVQQLYENWEAVQEQISGI